MAADLGAGTFTAADLYGWYVSLLKQEGREPVTKQKFGTALKEAGWHSSTEYLNDRMTRCWMVTKPWARRGLEYLNSDEANARPIADTGEMSADSRTLGP